MKWTAIDIGQAEVKAAVNGLSNKPEKLTYNNGISYSYMPSISFVSNDEVFIGNQVLLLEAMGTDGIVTNLNESHFQGKILQKFYSSIKQASVDFYSEKVIGAALVFDDASQKRIVEEAIEKIKDGKRICDSTIAKTATDIFSDVICICKSEVISSFNAPHQGLSMVVDFGYSSLKISIVDNGRQISHKQDAESGFSSVDLSDIVGYDYTSDVSDIEQILFGLYLKEVVRRNLNKNAKDYYPLPIFNDLDKGKAVIQKKFDIEMSHYLYQCFDSCNDMMRQGTYSWNNISNIIFCGGGANYHSLSQTFEDYQKAYGIKNDIAIKTFSKDAEWVGVFSTMRLPLERETSTISIDYNN